MQRDRAKVTVRTATSEDIPFVMVKETVHLFIAVFGGDYDILVVLSIYKDSVGVKIDLLPFFNSILWMLEGAFDRLVC